MPAIQLRVLRRAKACLVCRNRVSCVDHNQSKAGILKKSMNGALLKSHVVFVSIFHANIGIVKCSWSAHGTVKSMAHDSASMVPLTNGLSLLEK